MHIPNANKTECKEPIVSTGIKIYITKSLNVSLKILASIDPSAIPIFEGKNTRNFHFNMTI